MKTSKRIMLSFAATALAATTFMTGQAHAQTEIDFQINEGQVAPTEAYAARVSVLGAAITSGGQKMPVTVKFHVGESVFEPFGSHADHAVGNVNDDGAVRHHVINQMFDPSESIKVTATSWRTSGSAYLERNSYDQSTSVKVLRDGDPIPNIAGYDDQADAVSFLRKYLDNENGVMRLHYNQVFYLFELGTTNLSSSAADFQDLVVLVTLGDKPSALENFELKLAAYD